MVAPAESRNIAPEDRSLERALEVLTAFTAVVKLPPESFFAQLVNKPLETSVGSLVITKSACGYTASVDLPGPSGPGSYPYDYYEYEISAKGNVYSGRQAVINTIDDHPSLALAHEEAPWRQLDPAELVTDHIGNIVGAAVVEGKYRLRQVLA